MGIVHGDLKPSNLFVARCDGSVLVKVLDLGISRWSGAATHYMSPEQMTTASDVDARADVWALGVILFELVCGHPPFIGESPLELCRLVLYGATPSVTEFVPELPRELDAVIQGCLAKSHEQRYAGMSELAQALLPFAPRRAALSFERISRLLPTGSTQPAS
jgi:serine/threonine-protein kinase